jgi:glycosyltransferase involved in cell wall biosynthesis
MSAQLREDPKVALSTELSVVIPVFNGAATVGRVVRSILQTFPDKKLEIILVNDGSTDDSALTCSGLVEKFKPQVRYIELDGNHGEHNAVLAGLNHANGAWVAIMDDDGQNTSAALKQLYDHAQTADVEVVYCGYTERKHSLFRRLGSLAAQKTSQFILGTPPEVYLSSFKIMKQALVQKIVHDAPANPYIDGLVFQENPSWDMISVDHQDRLSGQSSYTLRRLISLWLNIFITADRTEKLTTVRTFRAVAVLILAVLAAFWLPWTLALAAVYPRVSLGLLVVEAWICWWCGWSLFELTNKMNEELSGVEPFTISMQLGKPPHQSPEP